MADDGRAVERKNAKNCTMAVKTSRFSTTSLWPNIFDGSVVSSGGGGRGWVRLPPCHGHPRHVDQDAERAAGRGLGHGILGSHPLQSQVCPQTYTSPVAFISVQNHKGNPDVSQTPIAVLQRAILWVDLESLDTNFSLIFYSTNSCGCDFT